MFEIAEKLKSVIKKSLGPPKHPVAVMLSGGLDSSIVTLLLKDLGYDVTAYSLHIEGIDSSDFHLAKINAEYFGIPFVEIEIPKKLDMALIKKLVKEYDCKKKTDVECLYCYYKLLEQVKEKDVYTGIGIDTMHCNDKKGKIHFSQTLELLNEYREDLFHKRFETEGGQSVKMQKLWKQELRPDGNIINPFGIREVVDIFHPLDWAACNKPREKVHVYRMYQKEMDDIKSMKKTNMQCGDSGIREVFEVLMADKKWNPKNRKRMMDVYRDLWKNWPSNTKKVGFKKH